VRNLLAVLQRLVDAGNTVVVIEHHMDVMLNADHIIDLGPLGGERGGELIAEGTPEEVARHATSATGRYLREALARRGIEIQSPQEPAVNGRKRRAKVAATT
jgi:excinuclease ABC subunit A